MPGDKTQKRDWLEVTLKALAPIFGGLLIAWAGFVGNKVLTSISSKQESARLITELQIKREQDESMLRKDVFDKALEAFLLNKQANTGTLEDMSKQLLRLELLALNFGDSLSLSPLFSELRNDLDRSKPINGEERRDYAERRGALRKRLDALAKRVASSQLSSIAQHGQILNVLVPLDEYRQLMETEDDICKKALLAEREYGWPRDKIVAEMGFKNYKDFEKDEELKRVLKETVRESGLIELNGVKHYLELYVTDVNPCKKTAKVQIILVKDPNIPEVNRSFRLDFFNFPMVDNTRLSDNQRFAVIMDAFELKGDEPHIEITGIVFPSEYASLRDRPGMLEARKLLESALKSDDDKKN